MKKVFIACLIACWSMAGCTNEGVDRGHARQAALVPPQKTGPIAGDTQNKNALQSGEIVDDSTPATASPAPPIIIKGSGNFAAPNNLKQNAIDTAGGDITLNFVDADIKDVIKGILGDILNATYVIAPNVTGRITIKTNTPLTRSEVLPTLEQVLAANGLGLIAQDGRYSITLLQDIKETPLIPTGQQEGFGNQIVRLHHVTAAEVVKVLEQYGQPNTVKTVPSAPNLLVLSGTSPDRSTLQDIVRVFDIDRFAGMSFGIFPISSADPDTLVKELTKIFTSATGGASAPGVLEFMPIDRLNAILAIAADPARLDQVKGWIDRLDRGEPVDEPRLYVHYVQHGEAKHIAQVLRSIFNAGGSDKGNANTTQQNAGDQTQSAGAAGGGGFSTDNADLPGQSAPAGQPTGSVISNQNQYVMPGNATVANSPGSVPNQDEPTAQDGKSKTRIIADDSNNAIFVVATPHDYRLIDAALQHLDVTPLQVMIEATIAEVTLNDELKYGVQWFFKQSGSTITLSDIASGAVAAEFPGFGFIYSGHDTQVVLTALDQVTNVKVISSPQIMVLDNKTAKLQVGDQVPISTQSAVSTLTPDAPVVNSIEYKDTGVILTVTPRVNSSGAVGLDIEQEVSDVAKTQTSGIDSPTIAQRKLKTAVTVQDGETIALGGLIRDRQERDKNGIPLLDDIPLLGNLFKTTDNTGMRTELLVLLTPHVVRNPAEAREITDDLRKRVRALIPLNQKIAAPNGDDEP